MMKVMVKADKEKIDELLSRGVERIYPSRQALEEVLMSGKKLRIYNGIDPTGKLHIGHTIALRKLRQFQDLGHEIVVLIGDFTATIGDPTGKSAARKPLTRQEVLQNAKTYKTQIGKILDLKKTNIRFLYNGSWLNKLTPGDMLKLASHFTVARLLERDMFQERIHKGMDIHVHEFLYPIFQAYDSVAIDVDAEVGGNDQMFNMMRGRDLMKDLKHKEKFVMALKLLTDPSGRKMGKTEGNTINLDEEPGEILGKIMSWPDSMIELGFEALTDIPLPKEIKPRDAKMRLAREVVARCRGRKAAEQAERDFNKIFREGGLPSVVPAAKVKEKSLNILDLLVKIKLISSKAEAKRLAEQGGVSIDGQIIKDWRKIVAIKSGLVVRVGKRKFTRIK